MNNRNRRPALAAGILAAGLALAGCSSTTGSDSGSDSEAPPASPSESHATGTEHIVDSSEEDPGLADDAVRPDDAGAPEGYVMAELAPGVVVPDNVNMDEMYVHPGHPPLTQADLDSLDPDNELIVECSDPAALAANEGHEPAGWPAGVASGDPLPDPECHPDFIEVHEWDRFDEFHACFEGPETSTAIRTSDMSDAEANRILWDQSQARANWEWPQNEEPFWGASDECVALYEQHGSW